MQNVAHSQRACLAIKMVDKKLTITKEQIERTKGIVILSDKAPKENKCYQFKAEINISKHSTTISNKFSTVIECKSIRQQAQIVLPPDIKLKADDTAVVTFRFGSYPVYLEPWTPFSFREGIIRGDGFVTEILRLDDDPNKEPANQGKRRRFTKKFISRRYRGKKPVEVK